MNNKYDRYNNLREEGNRIRPTPFINLPELSSDKFEKWHRGVSRLDKISHKYYGSPVYGFFILLANPKFLSEWDIPDGMVIRIPFPLSVVKAQYEGLLEKKINM